MQHEFISPCCSSGGGPLTIGVQMAAKIGRNDPCTCGSGKKHKNCCLNMARPIVRGVIANAALCSITPSGFTLGAAIGAEEIRYYALYWDKVVIPTTNLVHVEVADETELIRAQVVQRPKFTLQGQSFRGNELGYAMLNAQSSVARQMIERDRSTEWVIHQFGSEILVPDGLMSQARVLRFELASALPVPSGDVPLPDVLEFKHRRYAELLQLHECMDAAYLDALRSPDPGLSAKTSIANLRKAVSDLDLVSKERWKVTSKFDLSTELSVDGGRILQGAAAGAAFDFFATGMAIPIGATLGAIASVVRISAKASSTADAVKDQLKLAYLSRAIGEKIVQK